MSWKTTEVAVKRMKALDLMELQSKTKKTQRPSVEVSAVSVALSVSVWCRCRVDRMMMTNDDLSESARNWSGSASSECCVEAASKRRCRRSAVWGPAVERSLAWKGEMTESALRKTESLDLGAGCEHPCRDHSEVAASHLDQTSGHLQWWTEHAWWRRPRPCRPVGRRPNLVATVCPPP